MIKKKESFTNATNYKQTNAAEKWNWHRNLTLSEIKLYASQSFAALFFLFNKVNMKITTKAGINIRTATQS